MVSDNAAVVPAMWDITRVVTGLDNRSGAGVMTDYAADITIARARASNVCIVVTE